MRKSITERSYCDLVLTTIGKNTAVMLEVFVDNIKISSVIVFSGPKEIAQDIFDGKMKMTPYMTLKMMPYMYRQL